jgi:hypothetical protein
MGLAAPHRDGALPVEINMGLDWATYLGGSDHDVAQCVAVSPSGDVAVAAETHSADFPLTPGSVDPTYAGSYEVSVSRLDPTGSNLLFSTYLGGVAEESPTGVAFGSDGTVTVSGSTRSSDFPVTPGAYDTTLGGIADMFVSRLSADGQSLVWSTFIGDSTPQSFPDNCRGLALSPDGSVYVCGDTRAVGYPVTPGAFDTTPDSSTLGLGDLVVSHLSADGTTLLQSTFVSGSSSEFASAIAWTADGVVITGHTQSPDFPTTPGAFDTQPPTGLIGLVTKLNSTLNQLVFSTFLGGHQGGEFSRLLDVTVDTSGAVTVTGFTTSSTWPATPGGYDTTFNGAEDVFVTRLDPTGRSLEYSTYIGGGDNDGGTAVVVDSAGVATIAGFTWWNSGFPATPGAWDATGHGNYDAFVARLAPSGDKLWYSTHLGGLGDDSASSIRADVAELPDGSVVTASLTESRDFPVTPGAFDTTYGGLGDSYIAKLSMLPTGVSRYGDSTEGCAGYLAIGVTAMPQVGKSFSMTCRNAPPSSTQGVLAVGASDLSQPLMAKGAEFWVNPTPILLLLPMVSNAVGFASLGGTLPNAPALVGASFTVQCFWPDACAPSGPISASNALAVTIQP